MMSPKLSSNSFVFGEYINETGFTGGGSTTAYVCCIGLIMPLFAMIGFECGGTMAEETINSRKASPKSMTGNVALSGIFGFYFIISILYGCRGDLDGILTGNMPTASPVTNIIAKALTTVSDNGTS